MVGAMVFLFISASWTLQVIRAVVHVTISGTAASFYFLAAEADLTAEDSEACTVRPVAPTLAAFKRSITTSFGSICLGTLLVAIASIFVGSSSPSDGGAAALSQSCCNCFCGCLVSLLQYFNYYAYTQVAIYGKPFVPAAKDTWHLMKRRGMDLVVNDTIINSVVQIGALLIAVITGVVTYFFLYGTGAFNDSDTKMVYSIVFAVVCALFGASILSIVGEVIHSGVSTTFVCLADDPEALRRTKPSLWEKFRDTFPSIVHVDANGQPIMVAS